MSAPLMTVDAEQVAAAILRTFHDIQSLEKPSELIAMHHTARAMWSQCIKTGDVRMMAKADLLAHQETSCVVRMTELCLREKGSARRKLHKLFTLATQEFYPPKNEDILSRVPLWFYRGAWG